LFWGCVVFCVCLFVLFVGFVVGCGGGGWVVVGGGGCGGGEHIHEALCTCVVNMGSWNTCE